MQGRGWWSVEAAGAVRQCVVLQWIGTNRSPDEENLMERQASISPEPVDRPDNCHIVEVTGQVRGVQMRPPGADDGGEFQLLLDSGDTIVSPYPAEWHLEVASNLQANYMLGAKVRGIGEYSPKGEVAAHQENRFV